MRILAITCFSAAMILLQTACAPISVNKCYEDYKYNEAGKITSIYKECIQQVPEKTAPIHLKHSDLYE